MKLLKLAAAVTSIGLVGTLSAQNTISYGWEDGGTILGSFGNLANPLNVSYGTHLTAGDVTPFEGSSMLQIQEAPNGGTPQAYVAMITGLTDGDLITASFYAWSHVDESNPSMRIWGHYTDGGDVDGYSGSASGNFTYSSGDGVWSLLSHTWTFDSSSNTRDGLIVEARLYSPTDLSPIFWVDNLSVTAPSTATIFAAGTAVVPEPSTIAAILGLFALGFVVYRRRR